LQAGVAGERGGEGGGAGRHQRDLPLISLSVPLFRWSQGLRTAFSAERVDYFSHRQ